MLTLKEEIAKAIYDCKQIKLDLKMVKLMEK